MSASSSRATATVVLATKVGNRGQGPNSAAPQKPAAGHRPELDRLGTDYVDIYYLHKDFADAPLEETIEAMGDIVASGKARHFGVSNFRGWRIAEVVRLCGELGVAKPVACQPYYNAMNRQPEAEILPACHHYGIGVVPYRPLARGVLWQVQPARRPRPTAAGRNDRGLETNSAPSRSSWRRPQGHPREGQTAPVRLRWVLATGSSPASSGPPRSSSGGLPGRAGEVDRREDEALWRRSWEPATPRRRGTRPAFRYGRPLG